MAGITLTPGAAGTRGCGKPQKNATYLRPKYDPEGVPLDDFFFCPPKPLSMDLPARGVKIKERDGVHHVFKRIGLKSYPSCYGWVKEALRKGPSVRVSSKLDFSLLTEDSKLIIVHPKAIIENASEYRGLMADQFKSSWCSLNDDHDNEDGVPLNMTCKRTWKCDMDMDGNPVLDINPVMTYFQGDMEFYAYPRHPDIKPQYKQGIVASVPISIAVIDGHRSQEVYDSIDTTIYKSIVKS